MAPRFGLSIGDSLLFKPGCVPKTGAFSGLQLDC